MKRRPTHRMVALSREPFAARNRAHRELVDTPWDQPGAPSAFRAQWRRTHRPRRFQPDRPRFDRGDRIAAAIVLALFAALFAAPALIAMMAGRL